MNLEDFFSRKQVVKIKSTEKQLAVKELLGHLDELKLINNKDRLYAQIVHRESLENTGIGKGLAIPHTRTESVKSFISILGLVESEDGIDYGSDDNEPVKYILLNIFPSSMSTKYLYLIGMIARIISNPEKKNEMDQITDPGKLFSHLKKTSKDYFKSISEKDNENYTLPVDFSGVPSSDLDFLIRLDRLYNLLDGGDESSSVSSKIENLRKLIDNRSLTYYERMRKKKNNPFAIVEKNSCTGCHMGIPPVDVKKIMERSGINVCSYCGRFLIIV